MPLRCPRPIAIGLLCVLSASAAGAEIVVTATRVAETVDDSLAAVTVITRDEIERSQARDIMDVMRRVPGVDLTRNGGPGTATSLFLRGTNSDHVLVLIDGVRSSSATVGSFAWEHLQPSQIERIEVVRGPRAAFYGSDAIGGVVQIFTRQAQGSSVRVTAGSFETRALEVGVGGGAGIRYSLFASRSESDGFSATNINDAFGFDPDEDGYENTSLSARWEIGLATGARLAFALWHSEGVAEIDDGSVDPKNRTLNQTASLRLDQAVSDSWSQILTLGLAHDELDARDGFPARFETRRTSLDWQHDLTLSPLAVFSLGLNYYEDRGENVDNSVAPPLQRFDESIDNAALFASYRRSFGEHDLEIALRHDDHSRFGGETTGQFAWGHDVGETLRLVASYGTAFKAPSLNQLFHPGFGGSFSGNPALAPEESASMEFGARWRLGIGSRLAVNLFRTEVDNLIAFQGVMSQAINIARAGIDGLELEYGRRAGAWDIGANLTLQDARDVERDAALLRRPKSKASIRIDRRLGSRGTAGGEWFLSSDRADFGGVELPGYGLVNLSASYELARDWLLEAKIENLFDKFYELAFGFNTPERSLFVSVRYTPGGRGGEN